MNHRAPNILFLYSDQHRADVMGCAGNEVVSTPHLDRLASEGTRFTNAWTESPICQPARASLLTGQFPVQHGILGNFAGECDPDWKTFPRALQQAGYETAVFGKTHYTNWPMGSKKGDVHNDDDIRRFGYDHVVEEFDRYVHVNFDTPYTRFVAARGDLERYRQTVNERFRIGDRHWEAVTSPLPQELDLTSFLADEAKNWLQQRRADTPWFLNLAFVQPHVPLMADPEWADYYRDADIPRTSPALPESGNADWMAHIDMLRKHSHSELLADEFVLEGARQYYAMVSLIDQKIGELLALLAASGDLDNTVIVYASDHGEMLGDHGLMAKMCFYRSSVSIPMLMRVPGGVAANVHEGPVQGIDMVATMLALAGASPLVDSPAQSLLPILKGEPQPVREVASSMIRMRPNMPTWMAVTDGRYRVTYNHATDEPAEFFDLATDPDEARNGAMIASNRDAIARLQMLGAANLAVSE